MRIALFLLCLGWCFGAQEISTSRSDGEFSAAGSAYAYANFSETTKAKAALGGAPRLITQSVLVTDIHRNCFAHVNDF